MLELGFLRLETNLSLRTSKLTFSLSTTTGNSAKLCPIPSHLIGPLPCTKLCVNANLQ